MAEKTDAFRRCQARIDAILPDMETVNAEIWKQAIEAVKQLIGPKEAKSEPAHADPPQVVAKEKPTKLKSSKESCRL